MEGAQTLSERRRARLQRNLLDVQEWPALSFVAWVSDRPQQQRLDGVTSKVVLGRRLIKDRR